MKKLASSNPEEQEHGQILADKILDGRAMENIICDDTEVKIKMNRTVINKCSINENSTDEEMSKGIPNNNFYLLYSCILIKVLFIFRSIYEKRRKRCKRKGGK